MVHTSSSSSSSIGAKVPPLVPEVVLLPPLFSLPPFTFHVHRATACHRLIRTFSLVVFGFLGLLLVVAMVDAKGPVALPAVAVPVVSPVVAGLRDNDDRALSASSVDALLLEVALLRPGSLTSEGIDRSHFESTSPSPPSSASDVRASWKIAVSLDLFIFFTVLFVY